MDRLICPDCGKLFTSKRSLFGHKKEKHSGPVEIFPCTDCGKNFSRKANLKVSFLPTNWKNPTIFCSGSQRFITLWEEVSMFFLWKNFYKQKFYEPAHQENTQWPNNKSLKRENNLKSINIKVLSVFVLLIGFHG